MKLQKTSLNNHTKMYNQNEMLLCIYKKWEVSKIAEQNLADLRFPYTKSFYYHITVCVDSCKIY
jgi:hypothetical protein